MALLVLTLGVSAYTVFRINQKIHQESLEKQVEAALGYAQEIIEARKRAALSVSLILSRSPSIIQAYQDNNRQAVFAEVSTYLEGMESVSGFGPIDVQFHTQGLEAWVRSWDEDSYGMPLSSFRKGLVHVKETKTPQVSIELGKRLNIKAISPILYEEEFLGSVEVIFGFESISSQLMSKGIEFMVLLDRQHLDIAEWERTKNRVGDYSLISETCPCKESLEAFASEEGFAVGFLEDETRVYGFLPLFNVDAMPLGYFGVALQKESLQGGGFRRIGPDEPVVSPPALINPSQKAVDIR